MVDLGHDGQMAEVNGSAVKFKLIFTRVPIKTFKFMIILNFVPGCHFKDMYILSGLITKFLVTVSKVTGETNVFLSPLPKPTE